MKRVNNKATTVCFENGAKNNTPCWICGGRINYRTAYRAYRTAATVHYLIPLTEGGDALEPSNLVPAHKQCVPPINSRRW